MIPRELTERLLNAIASFPVVSLTGPRQSGKSTLLKHELPDYRYVSLEDPLLLVRAKNDPDGFLDSLGDRAIIDEVQHLPELFHYLQLRVDEKNRPGMYVLSGSQNFLMMKSISQTLAGRVSILRLPPLSAHELEMAGLLPQTTAKWIFSGGYPRIFDQHISPEEYYPSYIETYLERDVRTLRNVGDFTSFVRFVQVLAGRTGQLLVMSDHASDADVSVPTAKAWLSMLETSYVVFRLPAMHRNITSRASRSPKLYFWDTGLACSLLGIRSAEQVSGHYLYGSLFENMVACELLKALRAQPGLRDLSFWRNNRRQEVDLLVEDGPANLSAAIEVKSARTPRPAYLSTLDAVGGALGVEPSRRFVAFDGSERVDLPERGSFVPWRLIREACGL